MKNIRYTRRLISTLFSAGIGCLLWVKIMWGGEELWFALLTVWVTISAGIGGYVVSKFFARESDPVWKSAVVWFLGAVLATLIGSAIAGFGVGFFFSFAGAPSAVGFGILIAPYIVFRALFSDVIVLAIWLAGFGLLEFVARKYGEADISVEDATTPDA